MKNILCALALVGAVLFASPSRGQSIDPQTEKGIAQLREGLVDSFNHGDIDKLVTFLDTNAVVTWQNGEVCAGTAEVKAYYEHMMKGDHPIVSKVTADPKISGRLIEGDWAVSWGELNDHFILADGSDLPLNSHFTATIARRGDHWRVTAFHVSVNAFDNPILKLAAKRLALIAAGIGLVAGVCIGLLVARLIRLKSTRK